MGGSQEKENFANRARRIRPKPTASCRRATRTYMPFPFEIVQTPKTIAIACEFAHALRNIPMDGSPHPMGCRTRGWEFARTLAG